MIVVALFLAATSFSDAASKEAASDSKESSADSQAIEGLWSGSWGGGEREGVVFQPAIAEMLIKANHVELSGFPNVGGVTGTADLDTSAKRMRITPAAVDNGQPPPQAIHYAYEIKGDELTLIDSDKFRLSLQRVRVVHAPLCNARVELVAAAEINDAGDLLVTEFTVLRAGRAGATYFAPVNRSLKTEQATVGLIQEVGWRKATVDEARRLIRESTPVVVLYRDDDRPSPDQVDRLIKKTASPLADSEAVWRTLSRILRPGTLVFILAHQDVPPP